MLWRPIWILLYLTVEAGDTFDFESLRLDWMRLQVKPYIIIDYSVKESVFVFLRL